MADNYDTTKYLRQTIKDEIAREDDEIDRLTTRIADYGRTYTDAAIKRAVINVRIAIAKRRLEWLLPL